MTVILTVGHEAIVQETRSSVLRACGYVVESASSAPEAIDRFRTGDFDLVLLCHSLSDADKEWLIRQIRADGSCVPILCVAPISHHPSERFVEMTVDSHPDELLRGIENALNGASGKEWAQGRRADLAESSPAAGDSEALRGRI